VPSVRPTTKSRTKPITRDKTRLAPQMALATAIDRPVLWVGCKVRILRQIDCPLNSLDFAACRLPRGALQLHNAG